MDLSQYVEMKAKCEEFTRVSRSLFDYKDDIGTEAEYADDRSERSAVAGTIVETLPPIAEWLEDHGVKGLTKKDGWEALLLTCKLLAQDESKAHDGGIYGEAFEGYTELRICVLEAQLNFAHSLIGIG